MKLTLLPSQCRGVALLTALFVLLLTIWLSAGCTRKKSTSSAVPDPVDPEGSGPVRSSGPSYLDILNARHDKSGCREALLALNNSVTQGKRKVPSLDGRHREEFRDPALLGLGEREIKEIESNHFSMLDGNHLEGCFLFRDAAVALNLLDEGRLSTLEKARIGFDWVIREVRLAPMSDPDIPPQFALRRGFGSELERALCFLALLDQIRCDGCLLTFPPDGKDPAKDLSRHLVCGVLVDEGEEKQLYLFDPTVGIPLPGPGGQGIATLQSIQKEKHLLAPLGAEGSNAFAVVPSQLLQVSPLSSLAARNDYLQKELETAGMRIWLADLDVQAKKQRFEQAVKQAKLQPAPTVEVPLRLTTNLQRFLPPPEGGTDDTVAFFLRDLPGYAAVSADRKAPMNRMFYFGTTIVDWRDFPVELSELDYTSPLVGLPPRNDYLYFFYPYHGLSNLGRDQVLRGQYTDAATWLSTERDELPNLIGLSQRSEAEAAEAANKETENRPSWYKKIHRGLPAEVKKWKDQVERVYNQFLAPGPPGQKEQEQAELVRLMGIGKNLWYPYLAVTTAGRRASLASYQLALCRHEQAQQLQSRMQLAGTQATDDEKAKVTAAWKEAVRAWGDYTATYQGVPTIPQARLCHAHALAALGNNERAFGHLESAKNYTGRAVKLLTEHPDAPPLPELDRLGRKYLAEQLQKQ